MKQIISHFRLLIRAGKQYLKGTGTLRQVVFASNMLVKTILARTKGVIKSKVYRYRILENLLIQRAELSAVEKYAEREA